RADGTAFGVMACTSWRLALDLSQGITVVAEGPAFPVILIHRPSPEAVLRALKELTGPPPLPPRWALGYHQSRWSYTPANAVRDLAREFRERKVPCSVLWMDIDYMKDFRIFTVDEEGFGDPRRLNEDLHGLGFRTVWMIDPAPKRSPDDAVYASGTEGGHWVRSAGGHQDYLGEVWPGPTVFPDFTRPETRQWWAELYPPFVATGIDGIWNDMNEPADFGSPTKDMTDEAWHRGGKGDDFDLPPGPHPQYHNLYGFLMVKASRDGLIAARPDQRPFILTRANFLGGHRYAATWTGDNGTSWNDLAWSVTMALNLGLSGQPFSGPDIGGFMHRPGEVSEGGLFARWMGVGALLPFARGHAGKDMPRKEPWAFGPEVEATCRRALELRSRLVPYLYTLFYEASKTGLPVMRPLFLHDPTNPAVREEYRSFTLGRDVLVETRLSPAGTFAEVRPEGRWLELPLGVAHDPELPRLCLRAGALLPLGAVEQWVGERDDGEHTLMVALDDQGRAEGVVYEDDGDSFAFEQGVFRLTTWEAIDRGDFVEVRVRATDGLWEPPRRPLRVLVLGIGEATGTGEDPIRVQKFA
ncbi:MAG: TIM-barrel domain-containing protein, partial [Myxococcota bacterium]